MTATPLWSLTAAEQRTGLGQGEFQATDVLASVQQRIADCDTQIHSFCTVATDAAQQQASSADQRIATGTSESALLGIPISIKDLIDTAEIRTSYGSRVYADRVPTTDDVVVERLKQAGASILGKTNTSEFGYLAACHNKLFPTTRNPWNLQRTPGGSSGGAAAAVAAGMGAIAIGSDGGGSVRLPAALTSVVGFKGSYGVVPSFPGCRNPQFPGASSWETLEVLGVLARTVADVARVMSVIAGPDPRDRHAIPSLGFDWLAATKERLGPLRVAATPDFGGLVTVDPEVRRCFTEAVAAFAELGCEVVTASPQLPDLDEAFAALIARDSDLTGMRAMIQQAGADQLLPDMVGLIERDWSAAEFTDAAMTAQSVTNTMSAFMAAYDLLLTPTVPALAFALDVAAPTTIDGSRVSPTHFLSFTRVCNITKQPAISVPAGWSTSGLPVGLQIVGRPLADRVVLAAASAYEQVRPWRDQWPPGFEPTLN